MKVAIIHYWLIGMRGGEKVLEAICELYPQADIFTHVLDREVISPEIAKHNISTTFINRLPLAKKYYQTYLPLMPIALEQLDLSEYDLVISSESGPAKGVITRPDSLHICYCHTPMRYAWDMYHDYLRQKNVFIRTLMRPLLHYIRLWDYQSAARVDYFIANSNYVAKRISKFYRRDSEVINPPVDFSVFATESAQKEDYYLLLGQLVNYKKADLAIAAFNKSGKKLLIIGQGEQEKSLREIAGPNIEFVGWQTQSEIIRHLQSCRALIFPGIEDFGIVPLEAMASGTPVIAFAQGGALETVIDGKTGLFFNQQSIESLNDAVERYERAPEIFIDDQLRLHAQSFAKEKFLARIQRFINDKLEH